MRPIRSSTARLAGVLLVFGGLVASILVVRPVVADAPVGVPRDVELARSPSLVVTEKGAIVDGLEVRGSITVRVDDVVIRNTRVVNAGIHSIRLASGVTGVRIEDSEIVCTNRRGNGVVFGGYEAAGVSIEGCRNGFVATSQHRTVVSASEWNGRPVQLPEPVPDAEPVTGKAEPATPSRKADAAPPGPAPRATEHLAVPGASVSRPGPGNTGHRHNTLETITAEEAKRRLARDPLLERVRITGSLRLSGAEGVGWTIRDSVLEGGQPYVVQAYISQQDFAGTVAQRPRFEHVTLIGDGVRNPSGKGSSACFYGHDTVMAHVHAYGCVDIFKPYDRVLIERSYAHSVHKPPKAHVDIVQIRQGTDTVIRGNSFDAKVGYGMSVGSEANAVLQTGSLSGSVRRVQFTDNYVVGGTYTLRLGSTGYPQRNEAGQYIDYTFRRNRHGQRFTYGPVDGSTDQASSLGGSRYDASNVWDRTGRPVVR